MSKKRHLLIDADYLVYLGAFGVETEIDWGDDLWTLHSDLGDAQEKVSEMTRKIVDELKADKVTYVLSCPTESNFRRQLNPGYKANRTSRKPVCYKPLREWFIGAMGAVFWPRLEADDVLGILATESVPSEDRIIVSVDKDFKGIPGKFYRLRPTGEPEKIVVSVEQATQWHLLQTLMGDKVDGYNGIPGVGPKTAEKILQKAIDENAHLTGGLVACCWPAIVAAYQKAGLTEEDALLNARMAWILRDGDYNKTTNKIKLWTP
jgi:5'-3' exonuclease